MNPDDTATDRLPPEDWSSSADRSEPFSFEHVCDALALDPDYIHQGLCRWRQAARARIACQRQPHGGTTGRSAPTRRRLRRHLRAA
jgi:hypothetical protein